MPRLALALPLALALASCAHAATYSITPTGSDSAAGDAAHPWATLQHAVDAVAPGDAILVQSGGRP